MPPTYHEKRGLGTAAQRIPHIDEEIEMAEGPGGVSRPAVRGPVERSSTCSRTGLDGWAAVELKPEQLDDLHPPPP